MVNIIKNKVVESLNANNFQYSEKHLDSITKALKFLEDNSLIINDPTIMSMFLNHMLVFLKRLESKENLVINDVNLMFNELNSKNVTIAREMLKQTSEEYGFQVNESEIFLIATHIENISNQQA